MEKVNKIPAKIAFLVSRSFAISLEFFIKNAIKKAEINIKNIFGPPKISIIIGKLPKVAELSVNNRIFSKPFSPNSPVNTSCALVRSGDLNIDQPKHTVMKVRAVKIAFELKVIKFLKE